MRKIVLSNLAQRKLNILLDYLEDEWSLTVANNFEESFEENFCIFPLIQKAVSNQAFSKISENVSLQNKHLSFIELKMNT